MKSGQLPPTIDPIAAERWHRLPAAEGSPWLHEEIGKRMEERLQWITRKPRRWTNWYPLRGGLLAHALVSQRFDGIGCDIVESSAGNAGFAARTLAKPWWKPSGWNASALRVYAEPENPPGEATDMIWSNMALHFSADPQALIARWHKALSPDGYLMFSCLGPDTLQELRAAYAQAGWPSTGAAFTDMHDWGDMLLQAGFAEPIMDMERIVLRYENADRLLADLRATGRNLHPQRFGGLRGRQFSHQLRNALAAPLRSDSSDGAIPMTIEVIYGHAFKAAPRARVAAQTAVSLSDMRNFLQRDRKP